MRVIYLLGAVLILLINSVFANGVGVINANSGEYLRLQKTNTSAEVYNQVSLITSTQTFINNTAEEHSIKYAFPLPDGASAVGLLYYINGTWYSANIAAEPQDTTFGDGDEIDPALKSYLGPTPLYFTIDQNLKADSVLIVELTYVQLLPYEFGEVSFHYPNSYTEIQNEYLESQEFEFNLNSDRTIEAVSLIDLIPDELLNDGNNASVSYSLYESSADFDYNVVYSLSLEELGLFGFSTFQPDTLVPDDYGQGFFTFIAEPDPGESTETINKVFTLIVDRSGSMSGSKIVQARNAANFIVGHLNDGDKFNIVDFSSDVNSFQPQHVEFNTENEAAAYSYINTFYANGMTNISGAFSTAIPQFGMASDSTANIIIFFTDGQATAGLVNTQEILDHVQTLINQNEQTVSIFTFGIGNDANHQLLTLLASQNNGLSEFLGADELESVITDFYLRIRNPVLINTDISFSSESVSEIYPVDVPNLYKGQQMIVAGRYSSPGDVNVTLSGEAFGQPVSYEYTLSLSDSQSTIYQFLPKIWAKKKIEHLMVLYYSLDPDSPEAEEIHDEIIQLSLDYHVITEFTSFSGGDPTSVEEIDEQTDETITENFKLLGNYPNPFNPSTKIRFYVGMDFTDVITFRIYNALGELITILTVNVNGAGFYEVVWYGLLDSGQSAPSGMYVYVVDFGNKLASNKMMLMK